MTKLQEMEQLERLREIKQKEYEIECEMKKEQLMLEREEQRRKQERLLSKKLLANQTLFPLTPRSKLFDYEMDYDVQAIFLSKVYPRKWSFRLIMCINRYFDYLYKKTMIENRFDILVPLEIKRF